MHSPDVLVRATHLPMTTAEYLALKRLLESNSRTLHDIRRRQSWWLDFGANVAGNAAYDGALWLLRRLLR